MLIELYYSPPETSYHGNHGTASAAAAAATVLETAALFDGLRLRLSRSKRAKVRREQPQPPSHAQSFFQCALCKNSSPSSSLSPLSSLLSWSGCRIDGKVDEALAELGRRGALRSVASLAIHFRAASHPEVLRGAVTAGQALQEFEDGMVGCCAEHGAGGGSVVSAAAFAQYYEYLNMCYGDDGGRLADLLENTWGGWQRHGLSQIWAEPEPGARAVRLHERPSAPHQAGQLPSDQALEEEAAAAGSAGDSLAEPTPIRT